MQMQQKIGLFGFGPVGQGTYKILSEDFLLPVEIAKICVKNPRKERSLDSDYFTFDKKEILQDEEINLIVEAISDADEAFSIVKEALEAGKHVVSANKKMISEHLQELLSIQKRSGSILRYEAAVGGAIPIIRTLDAYFGHEPVMELRGVLNGSTNYILSQMQQGLAYEEALQQAQDKGFAEADPFLDVSGQDARNKLVIAALHAFGEVLQPADVLTTGINAISAATAEEAKKEGKRIKLVALLKWNQDRLEASVQPALIAADDPLYRVEGENNLLMLQGAYSGLQTLSGKGAGALPTGTAVVADIRAVLEGKGYSYAKYHAKSLTPA
jgi:homoserine dehydrogenase